MPIVRSGTKLVQFAVLGAAGGGGGRISSSYQHTDHACGNGGCGSLVTAAFYIPTSTTLYCWVGKGGQGGRSTDANANHNTYGGLGAGSGSLNDTGGEGGEFSAVFTGNAVNNSNALIVAAGGGGAAGRPHSATAPAQRCNGGGGVNNRTWGAGNDGTKGNRAGTVSGVQDGSSEGGQKNAGGRQGTSSGTNQQNQATDGTNWNGGVGSKNGGWGSGGGGGAGLYGGGGGADDGHDWGGQGGGAGSSYIRGYKDSDYTDPDLNSMPAGFQCVHADFWLLDWGHRGGVQIGNSNLTYSMRDPIDIQQYTGHIGGRPNTSYGRGGDHTTSYPGTGTDGTQGIICYRKLDPSIVDSGTWNWFDTITFKTGWTQLTGSVGSMQSITI